MIGLLLLLAAGGLTAYNLWDDQRAGECAETMAAELTQALPDPEQELIPDYQLDPFRAMPTAEAAGWDCVGVLAIPTLELELPVIAQWSYPALREAPCRYAGSPYTGDLVIAAHNYSRHFGRLTALRAGDVVTFTDMSDNVFSYTVAALETLEPTEIEEMTASGYPLTLFTCTRGGQYRVALRCEEGA